MTLNIFGKKVRVLKKSQLSADADTELEIAGYYDPVSSVIAIHEKLVGDAFFHTLVHEIAHAVMHRTGVMQSRISPDIQEVLCENIATAITENFTLKQKKQQP